MTNLAFDTLAITKRLKSRGFSEAQAEAITEEIQHTHDININHLATKKDLQFLREDTKKDLDFLRADVDAKIRESELRLTTTIKDMQLRLGAMIVGLGAFLAAIKFLLPS